MDGQTLFHPIDKANALNKFLTNIFSITVIQNHASIGPDPPLQQMDTLKISDSEVLDQLQIMNISKPSGPDSVSPRILKYVALAIHSSGQIIQYCYSYTCLQKQIVYR